MTKNKYSTSKLSHIPLQGAWGLLFLVLLSSCSDFLSTLPDNRTQINTEKKISQLLVSAYPSANYAHIAELSSDNFVDNNAPNAQGDFFDLASFSRLDDQLFAWEPATASTQQDSPSFLWSSSYSAIAAANHAIVAIDELEKTNKTINLKAQRGEALLCRAYSHFVLVNIFSQAYKDETASALDLGIPYITEPETVVHGNYTRESVASVYAKIEADIEAGYSLLSDASYAVPKQHFTQKAAAAFAARFYLYKRNYTKVVEYADAVLTETPATMLRDWTPSYDNILSIGYSYVEQQLNCNLLIVNTKSLFFRIFGTRYGHNGDALIATTYGPGPTWTDRLPCYEGKLYIRGQQDYGVFFPKCMEMFEYTDKIAGIGYAHVVRAEFTAEETLLCRAEALIYLNRTAETVADLQTWNKSRLAPIELTEAIIRNYYVPSNKLYVNTLNTTKMSSAFVVTPVQEPFIQCVLHFRRIETIFDGYRWFDLKRYGIEIQHTIGRSRTETLTYDDPRRAIQLPQEVISAGMKPNPVAADATKDNTISKLIEN